MDRNLQRPLPTIQDVSEVGVNIKNESVKLVRFLLLKNLYLGLTKEILMIK